MKHILVIFTALFFAMPSLGSLYFGVNYNYSLSESVSFSNAVLDKRSYDFLAGYRGEQYRAKIGVNIEQSDDFTVFSSRIVDVSVKGREYRVYAGADYLFDLKKIGILGFAAVGIFYEEGLRYSYRVPFLNLEYTSAPVQSEGLGVAYIFDMGNHVEIELGATRTFGDAKGQVLAILERFPFLEEHISAKQDSRIYLGVNVLL